MNIITLTIHSVNCYLIGAGAGLLLIDTGSAANLPLLLSTLRQRGVRPGEIKFVLATHYHAEHAGLVQDVKNLGARLLLHPCQTSAMEEMDARFKAGQRYTPIEEDGNLTMDTHKSRVILTGMGITGSIVPTPGHSPDGVSLVVDNSCAFTGELPRIVVGTPPKEDVAQSWTALLNYGVHKIYPAHGRAYDI